MQAFTGGHTGKEGWVRGEPDGEVNGSRLRCAVAEDTVWNAPCFGGVAF